MYTNTHIVVIVVQVLESLSFHFPITSQVLTKHSIVRYQKTHQTYKTRTVQNFYSIILYIVAFHFNFHWHTIWQLCFGTGLVRKAKDCIACSQWRTLCCVQTKGHMIVSVARFLLWYHVYICRVFFPTLRNKSWQMPLRVLMSQSEHIHILVIWHSRDGLIHLLSTVLKTHAAYYTRTYKDKDDRKPDHEL